MINAILKSIFIFIFLAPAPQRRVGAFYIHPSKTPLCLKIAKTKKIKNCT